MQTMLIDSAVREAEDVGRNHAHGGKQHRGHLSSVENVLAGLGVHRVSVQGRSARRVDIAADLNKEQSTQCGAGSQLEQAKGTTSVNLLVVHVRTLIGPNRPFYASRPRAVLPNRLKSAGP